MGLPRSPLRTGLADFPQPALQLVGGSSTETGDCRDLELADRTISKPLPRHEPVEGIRDIFQCVLL